MKRIALFFVTAFFALSCNNNPDQNNTEQEMSGDKSGNTEAKAEKNELPKEVKLIVKTPGETMTDMRFEPVRLEVAANAKVTVVLKNVAESEAMIHNFVVIESGSQMEIVEAGLEAGPENDYLPESPKIIAATSLAKPGEEKEVEFTAPSKKGTYQYICTYPGHTKMKGILLVK